MSVYPLKNTNSSGSRVINANAQNNSNLQRYKQAFIKKATQELKKIEQTIQSLEQF